MKKNTVYTFSFLIMANVFFTGCKKHTSKNDKPNFIFFYTDNLGYGDLGCYGSKIHRTPNIDKFASEGIQLTSLYSSAPVCTPSRASLMTGCYAQRVDMHQFESKSVQSNWVLYPVSSKGLNPKENTIADILKEQDYATACIGKWHLGDQTEFLPNNHGFDYYYGIPYSEDMVPAKNSNWPEVPLLQNSTIVEAPVDLTTTTTRYVKEAINFITKNKENSFFLYFSHNLPGSRSTPIVDKQFHGKSANGPYGDAIEEIDWSFGEILNTVKQLGIDNNTMIIFASDNGTPQGRAGGSVGGSIHPFSGKGYDTMEGGMRVPGIVRWPGMIPTKLKSDKLCTMMDWLPTLAYLAEASIPQDRIIDGKNIWPIISGDPTAQSPHEYFYYYLMDQLQAIRKNQWKLFLPLQNKYDSGDKTQNYGPGELKLIDLNTDLKEEYDVSEQHEDVVDELLLEAQRISKTLGNTNIKGDEIRLAKFIKNPKPLLKYNTENHE
ncbi:MAG: sulfatase [Prolixibacteraceae bacterium]|nr:sulfatase [Prolixibacteraceae bacterium]